MQATAPENVKASMLTSPISDKEATTKRCKMVEQLQADGSKKTVKKCKRVRMKQQESVARDEKLDNELHDGAVEQLQEWAEKKQGRFAEMSRKALQEVKNGFKLAKKKATERIRRIPMHIKVLKQDIKDVVQKVAATLRPDDSSVIVAQDAEDTVTMGMMQTLDKVFFVLASDEDIYNRVVNSMPGVSTSGPIGTNTAALPYDFFLNLTQGTEDVYNGTDPREPGRFYAGEEEQWDIAVKELFQGMIDRIDDLWKSLIAFSENNESWSMWAARWVLGPVLQIDVADASFALQMCKKVMLILCQGDDVTSACKNPLLKGVRIRMDLNEQWSRHCTENSQLSYNGSMFCGLGEKSDFANLLTRITPMPLPAKFRKIQLDWVIALCNTVLYMLLPGKEYYQELINDINMLPTPLTPEETEKLKTLAEKRDAAPTQHSAFYAKEIANWILKGPPEKDTLTNLRKTKQLRITKGQNYVFSDLDWAIRYLEILLKSKTIREKMNDYINTHYLAGIAIPEKSTVGAVSYESK